MAIRQLDMVGYAYIDGILVGFDNLAIKYTLVVEVKMEVPKVAATPKEEEWDLLLLQIGEHICMY